MPVSSNNVKDRVCSRMFPVRIGSKGVAVKLVAAGGGAIVFREACKLGCEGIVSKRLGPSYRSGRSPHWVKVKNPKAPAVKREAEEDWGR